MMNVKEIIKQAQHNLTIIGVAGFGNWLSKFLENLESNNQELQVKVLCENQNYLFAKSRIIDNNESSMRYSFSDLKFENELIIDKTYLSVKKNKNIDIKICYIDIPIRIIICDNKIYTNNWITTPQIEYKLVDKQSEEFDSISEFIKLISAENIGQKFTSPYWGKKNKPVETIELFDEDRIRRGIFPRSAFYDSGFIKLVVWVFIFDRNGKMLIHKRSENAKDNRDMWDKSVGGHADYINDIDTSRTVPREVIEELKTNENVESNFLIPRDDNVIFLGEWKPNKRYDFPFLEVQKYQKNWVYFKVPRNERTSSPRMLPDGTEKGNEVIADSYLFLLSDDKESDVQEFKNSSYKLLFPSQIKNAIENSDQNIGDPNFDGKVPKFTPDLRYAFKGKLRQELDSFSKSIRNFFNE